VPYQFALVVAAVLALCPLAICADPPKVDPEAAQLVKDLGSPQFSVREKAEQKLVELGSKAKLAVQPGTGEVDPEVARRREAVLSKIRAGERMALVSGKGDWPGPEGKRFQELAGGTPEARQLFALMTEDDRRAGLAEQAGANPSRTPKLYAAEVARLAEADARMMAAFRAQPLTTEFGGTLRDAFRKVAPASDVALMLFLGTGPLPEGVTDPAAVNRVFKSGFIDLATGPQKGAFRKLFAAWLDQRREPKAIRAGLDAALFAGFGEATPAARRLAADPKAEGGPVGTALVVLGHHGSKADLTRLSALRDDGRAYCVIKPVRGGADLEVQVREVAATMSLVLSGKDPKAYGFAMSSHLAWWADPDPAPYKTPSFFQTTDDRDAALKKAWDWLDQQPGAPPKPVNTKR
jgi:hypothetical protein